MEKRIERKMEKVKEEETVHLCQLCESVLDNRFEFERSVCHKCWFNPKNKFIDFKESNGGDDGKK